MYNLGMVREYDIFRRVWTLKSGVGIWVLLVPPHLPNIIMLRSNNKDELYINNIPIIKGNIWARIIERITENERNYKIIIEETIITPNKIKIINEYIYDEKKNKLKFSRIKDKYCYCNCHLDTVYFTNAYINESGCKECLFNHS